MFVMECEETLACTEQWCLGKDTDWWRSKALGFELRRQEQSGGLKVGVRSARLVVLVRQLLLRDGLLRDGLKAASALGLRAEGTAHRATFSQFTGERGIVDLLEVLLDFASGMLQ